MMGPYKAMRGEAPADSVVAAAAGKDVCSTRGSTHRRARTKDPWLAAADIILGELVS